MNETDPVEHARSRPGETALLPLVGLLTALRAGSQPPGAADPVNEAVRFRPVLSLAPSAGEVAAITPARDGRWSIDVGFLGLYGPSSPLPPALTEWLLTQDDKGRARGFLDIFNHRAIALFCRAARKYRSSAPDGPGGSSEIAARVSRLLGAKPAQDDRMLGFAGLLGASSGSAEGLEHLIGGWFSTGCTITQCVPRWTRLGPGERCGMGSSNCSLGSDLVVGASVLSAATSIRMVIGPISWREGKDWEPHGGRLIELTTLLARSDSAGLDCVAEILIDTSDMPQPPLGSAPLGRGGRLSGNPPACDRRVILDTVA